MFEGNIDVWVMITMKRGKISFIFMTNAFIPMQFP